MLENIGGSEILVILLIIFIFWGPAKLPEIGKYIGKGVAEFRRTMRDVQDNLDITPEIKDLRNNLDISKKFEDIKSDFTNNIKDINSKDKETKDKENNEPYIQ
jgi:TatA/E family protein of Tat protein translocase